MSGVGKRFLDAGYTTPKPLLLVQGKMVLEHILHQFPDVKNVLFIVNEKHFNSNELDLENTLKRISPNCKIAVVKIHDKGPGWAIKQSSKFIMKDAPVIVNYCDFNALWPREELRNFLNSDLDGIISTYTGFHPHMLRNQSFAYVKKNSEGFVIDIQEKSPWTDTPLDEEASTGMYGFRSGKLLLDSIDEQIRENISLNNEFYISLTYKTLLRKTKKVKTFLVDYFMQWGTPEDLSDFYYWDSLFEKKSKIENSPRSAPSENSLFLAAGEGKRFSEAGYLTPKPLLNIESSTIISKAVQSIGTKKNYLVTRKEVISEENISNIEKLFDQILFLNTLTRGQAESALFGLEMIIEESVTVSTCDSILIPSLLSVESDKKNLLLVWIQKNFQPGYLDTASFGWVKIKNNSHEIEKVKIKKELDLNEYDDWSMVTGTFTFGNSENAKALIKELIDSNTTVNNEYYLDSVIQLAIEKKWKVLGVEPDLFINLGTPQEYESFKYWQKCLSQWSEHPYTEITLKREKD